MDDNSTKSPFQEIIGGKITKFVIWGTIIIAVTGIAFAAIIVCNNTDLERVKAAFSILQYVFGALLPLWGTWIGTILAYYYSRQNFESANKSVQQIVDKMTSDKKLEGIKAKDVMIPIGKLVAQRMVPPDTLAKFRLKEDCLDFTAANKIKRILVLDDKDLAKYAIHRDLISFFIASETLAGKPVAGSTLQDMYTNGTPEIKNTMDNSVKFIGENASLLEAKNIMQQFKTCQDVFITKNGQPQDPILGWVTNVTITENSVV